MTQFFSHHLYNLIIINSKAPLVGLPCLCLLLTENQPKWDCQMHPMLLVVVRKKKQKKGLIVQILVPDLCSSDFYFYSYFILLVVAVVLYWLHFGLMHSWSRSWDYLFIHFSWPYASCKHYIFSWLFSLQFMLCLVAKKWRKSREIRIFKLQVFFII